MNLPPEEFQRSREILLGSDLPDLARCMTRIYFREPDPAIPPAIRAAIEDLGWIRPGSLQLTQLGWFAADSCREYCFWRDRDRRLPFADEAPELVAEAFDGKSVLEIGSGCGANLMSLAGTAREVVGLEPMGIYRQLGSVLAESEGIGGIRVQEGHAETLPFGEARFDTVLCVTAHQYFQIAPALREIARVLKEAGELVIIGSTLGLFAGRGAGRALGGSLSELKNYVVTMANTLGYMTLRRRVLVAPSRWSTAYPIYPSRRAMGRLIAEAGLDLARPPRRIGAEYCFRARKPGP